MTNTGSVFRLTCNMTLPDGADEKELTTNSAAETGTWRLHYPGRKQLQQSCKGGAKIMKKLMPVLLMVFVLLVSGCSRNGTVAGADNSENNQQQEPVSGNKSKGNTLNGTSGLFSKRDFEVGYDESTSAVIRLNGDTAATGSNAVKISGNTVTIADEGTYILSGTLNDGMIIVNADKTDKIRLVFDNVSVHSETSAPVYILKADKVFITLAADSVNTLSNGGMYSAIDENNIDAVIFSKEDLTLNGSGTLTITSPAGHGIVSKDELTLTSGKYRITAASHGLEGKDSVCIANAVISITAGKDGIHAENGDNTSLGFVYIQSGTFDITCDGDDISSSAYIQIDDGDFNIVSGGGSANAEMKTNDFRGGFIGRRRQGPGFKGNPPGSGENTGDSEDTAVSGKGIKATGNLTVNGGRFTIDAADDAVHSNYSVTIDGGTFRIAAGDDGFHADDTLTISSGTISISGCYEGLEALHVKISGGDITIYAVDDGINAAGGKDQSGFGGMRGNDRFARPGPGSSSSNGSIVISGGKLYINAKGDGIDTNGTLTISGGYTVVCGPTVGDTATLDYDVSGVITGGTFIGTGGAGMAQTFSDSEQGVVAVRVGNQPAGISITLQDSDGNTIIPAYEPELDFAVVILSSPDIAKGETCKLTIGSSTRDITAY